MYRDHLGNEFKSYSKMAEFHNIGYETFLNRIKSGYSIQEAVSKDDLRFSYTEEMTKFLEDNYYSLTLEELATAFNKKFGTSKKPKAIHKYCKEHGIKKRANKGVYGYTKEEDEFLIANAYEHSYEELTTMLTEKFGERHTCDSVRVHCRDWLKIKKPDRHFMKHPAFKEIGEVTYQGKKKTARIKLNSTGDERIDWMSYGRYVYIQHYGEIPEDYQVVHLDGDCTNNNIENLLAISKPQCAIINANKWGGLGEITRTGAMIAELSLLAK